ncbi:hypothetical protein EON64_10335, partial [archaeon]
MSKTRFSSATNAMCLCISFVMESRTFQQETGNYLHIICIDNMFSIVLCHLYGRLCYVCRVGLDPTTVSCELCSYKGGAYKPIDKPHKWAHPLCSTWIPELYEEHKANKVPIINTSKLDSKRFKLKCALCKQKGACVQCSSGRCVIAAHPWCALHTPQGFTRRIVRGPDDLPLWQIFCRTHASGVSEPVKVSGKHRNHANHANGDDADHLQDDEGASQMSGYVATSSRPPHSPRPLPFSSP